MKEQNTYNDYASQYAAMVESDDDVLGRELVIPKLLELAGTVDGLRILDAGCGEGRIARILDELGSQVVGIDISENLISIAKQRSNGRMIEFHCMDLSDEIPSQYENAFDLIISNLVLDDVPNHIDFIGNICKMANDASRIVLSKNNPYSAVTRHKVENYFDSGQSIEYRGLASAGVSVYYYHRTLEEYVNEFSKHGFFLSRMSDLEPSAELRKHENAIIRDRFNRYFQFPFLMVLEFSRIG